MLGAKGLISLASVRASEIQDFIRSLKAKDSPLKTRAKPVIGLMAFFEKSTRTRVSFEKAGLELGIRWLNFEEEMSSLGKGESLEETFRTLQEMDPDFYVLRHPEAGFPDWVSEWTGAAIFNAGDGAREHPTQALGDLWALEQRGLKKQKIAFYGDVVRSRVIRSCIPAFRAMKHEIFWVDDQTTEGRDFAKSFELPRISRKKIKDMDVVYALRTQKERGGESSMGPLRAKELGDKTFWMHPGPVLQNEDLDWALCQFENPHCLVRPQVRACLEVRRRLLQNFLKGRK